MAWRGGHGGRGRGGGPRGSFYRGRGGGTPGSFGRDQQPSGYGQQSSGYGHQPPGYGHQSPGYGHQSSGSGHQSSGSGHQSSGSGHQSPGYGHQFSGYAQQSYGQPSSDYSQQYSSYGQQSPGYNHRSPPGYGQQSTSHGQMPGPLDEEVMEFLQWKRFQAVRNQIMNSTGISAPVPAPLMTPGDRHRSQAFTGPDQGHDMPGGFGWDQSTRQIRDESPRDQGRSETFRPHQFRGEAPRGDQFRRETPRGDQFRRETPRGDQFRRETPRGDQIRESPRMDQTRGQTKAVIPKGAWVPLSQEELKDLLDKNPTSFRKIPCVRNNMWHEHCGQVHPPEMCRGPLKHGVLHTCALCAGVNHLTEVCEYLRLVKKEHIDELFRYLFVYCRQGLAPLASTIDFSHVSMTIGTKGIKWRPPLCPVTAALYENLQIEMDKTAGKDPYYIRYKWKALGSAKDELQRLPEKDACLGRWIESGPKANINANHVFRDYRTTNEVAPYDQNWIIFSNDSVPERSNPRTVHIPNWVMGLEDLVFTKKAPKRPRDDSLSQDSRPGKQRKTSDAPGSNGKVDRDGGEPMERSLDSDDRRPLDEERKPHPSELGTSDTGLGHIHQSATSYAKVKMEVTD
ncbi:hypothetical protein G7054_g9672 [Neopestalotiopsis clavispora]|nr:hypothetical protein G7054_g9672 [Neopestalotiopsis clavispora]